MEFCDNACCHKFTEYKLYRKSDFVAEEEEETPTDSLPEIDTLEAGDDEILTAGEETSVNKRAPDLSLLIPIAAGVVLLIVVIVIVVVVRKKKKQ